MTIPRFTDHAANERTFLAWVRTAIAVMAFGFLVERFDIFLKVAAKSLGAAFTDSGSVVSSLVGLAVIVAGALMVVGATLRFISNRTAIGDDALHDAENDRMDLILAGLIVVLGLGFAAYLGFTLVYGAHHAH